MVMFWSFLILIAYSVFCFGIWALMRTAALADRRSDLMQWEPIEHLADDGYEDDHDAKVDRAVRIMGGGK